MNEIRRILNDFGTAVSYKDRVETVDIDQALLAIEVVFERRIPKERTYFKRDFSRVSDYEKAKSREEGFNACIAELRKNKKTNGK